MNSRWKSLAVRLFGVATCLMLATSTPAGEVTFSGRDWITQEGMHRDNATIPIEYHVLDDETVEILGVFGSDAGVLTPVSLAAGDKISYDFQFTKDFIDLIGDGASDFIDDTATGFIFGLDHVGYQPAGVRVLYFNDPSQLWFYYSGDVSYSGTTPVETGVHVEWTIDTETDYSVKVWNIGTDIPVAEYAGVWNNDATIADIQGFRVGLWNSEQTTTFSNFVITPASPAGVDGDTDDDGDVDLDDLNAVRNNFGATGELGIPGDAYPFDGDVDLDDLNAVRNNFGATSTPVPEPATLTLLAVGALGLIVAKRQKLARSASEGEWTMVPRNASNMNQRPRSLAGASG